MSGESKTKKSNSSYKLNFGERRLPRPIVFWSDNEKDAFRRNKIVQTKYHMLLEDIETQQKASRRSIKFEAHKFRQKSAKYLKDASRTTSPQITLKNDLDEDKNKSKQSLREEVDGSDVISSASESEDDGDIWNKNNKKGKIITKAKKSIVKFSVYTETIPQREGHEDNDPSLIHPQKYRCQSALLSTQQQKEIPTMTTARSKSAVPDNILFNENRPHSRISMDSQRMSKVPEKRLFFDKHHAAYNLRQELQKLAKLRKRSNVTPTYDVRDYLKLEQQRYSFSRMKVNEYLRNFDRQNTVQSPFGE